MAFDKAESKFTVGTKVALFRGYSDGPSVATVYKVHKDGKFFLQTGEVLGSQMWTPNKYNNDRAKPSGSKSWNRDHAEVWTPAHDEAIAARKASNARCRRMNDLQRRIEKLRGEWTDEQLLDDLEAAMKAFDARQEAKYKTEE
jgi:hypothetical protein